MGAKFVKDFSRPLTVDMKCGQDIRKESNRSLGEAQGTKLLIHL